MQEHTDGFIYSQTLRQSHAFSWTAILSLSRLQVISLITFDTAPSVCMCAHLQYVPRGRSRESEVQRPPARMLNQYYYMLTHVHVLTHAHTLNKEMSVQWLEGIVSLSLWYSPSSPSPFLSSLSPASLFSPPVCPDSHLDWYSTAIPTSTVLLLFTLLLTKQLWKMIDWKPVHFVWSVRNPFCLLFHVWTTWQELLLLTKSG